MSSKIPAHMFAVAKLLQMLATMKKAVRLEPFSRKGIAHDLKKPPGVVNREEDWVRTVKSH